jgi:FimV-like protein
LTSVTAIVEPYLNFVIQFDWPNGRLVREYTLLLDPPALTVPGVSESSASELRNPLRPDRQSDSLTQELTQSKLGQASALTRSGDTLWEIALANRGDRRVSVQEMMLAIQSLNPEAFIDQNINRLKAGYRLVMPNDQDLQNYSAVEALAEVADQNRAQNIGIDETKSPESTSPDAEPVLEGELVLVVAPDQPKLLPLQSPATGTELLKVEAMLTEAASVNEVLQGRLAALEAQLAEVTSAISAKDQQIATLQRQLRALAEAPESDNHSALLNPVTLGLVAALIVLVVVMLLMSARYQRLARAVRATPMNRQDEPLPVASEDAKVDRSDQSAEETQVSEQIEAKDAGNAGAVRGQALKQVNDPGAQGVQSDSESAAPSSADEQARQGGNPSASTFSEDQDRLDLDELEPLEVDMIDLDELEDAEELSLDSSELSSLGDSMTASSEDESLFDEDEDPASMLDLARAYIDMGEPASARKLLARVQVIGVASEIEEAEEMLAGLSSS